MNLLNDWAWTHFAIAMGIGLLIGFDRERHKIPIHPSLLASSPSSVLVPTGIRTFALTSILGAISFSISLWLLIAALVAVSGLTMANYLVNPAKDKGLTTEVALIITMVLGAWSTTTPKTAIAMAVAVTLLLAARKPIHHFVHGAFSEKELHDLLLLAVAILLVLPLMPTEAIDPYGALRPRALWIVVILVMSISAAGHIVLRFFGSQWGLSLVGLMGGFVSSTATIAAMAARAKNEPLLVYPAASGAIFSTVGTVIQLTLVIAATNLPTLQAMTWPIMLAGFAALLCGVIISLKNSQPSHTFPLTITTGLSITSALLMGLLLGTVSIIATLLHHFYGQGGLELASTISGLVDTHAPAVSVAALVASHSIAAHEAVLPILLAFSTNTLSKCLAAFLVGSQTFSRLVIPGLLLVDLAAWIGWYIG